VSDIFISYSRTDRDRAQGLARALGQLGFEVWWDRKIPPGKTFDQVIQEALDASDCVVVLWSKTSVASDWVKEEAQAGLVKGALVPVLIDDVPIPLGFGRIQTANLVSWDGSPDHPELDQLARSVASLAGGRIDTRSYRLVREEARGSEPEREPEREPVPLVARPVPNPTPAPASHRSQPASGRRLPLAAALVAILVLSVAGVAYYAVRDDGAPELLDNPVEIADLAGDPDVDTEGSEQDSAPGFEGAEVGLQAPARVVPASLDAAEEAERKARPTKTDAGEVPSRVPAAKDEAPKQLRRPATPPAPESVDPTTAVLRRAASADLPLHARRDFLYGNQATLGDERAEYRVGEALRVLNEEMELSASIIEAKNFVVGTHLVRDGDGTPSGAGGVAEELRPGTVSLFARVRSPGEESLKLEWRDGAGRVLGAETIQVGRSTDPGYRIGLDHTFTEPGRYEVRLYNQAGTLIGLRRFEIER
jgi:hypothetical protein